MAMNIEVYNSVFAKNDRKEFPLDCLNSKPPRIKTTRVFKSSKQAVCDFSTRFVHGIRMQANIQGIIDAGGHHAKSD